MNHLVDLGKNLLDKGGERYLKLSENTQIILLSIILFILYQIYEYFLLLSFDKTYFYMALFDVEWYESIVDNGYMLSNKFVRYVNNVAFFPLVPLAASAIKHIFHIHTIYALIITSKIFFFLSIPVFIKMGKLYYPHIPNFLFGLVVICNPYAIYGNIGYTESAFLFFTCLFFIFYKTNHEIYSGISAAFLSATRAVGICGFIILLYNYLMSHKKILHPDYKRLLCVLIAPLGLAIFMCYLYFHMGDALAFSHIQRAWHRDFTNPINTFISSFMYRGIVDTYWAITIITIFILSFYTYFRNNNEMLIFIIFCTGVPLCTSLWSIMRYTYWQAPVLLLFAIILSYRNIWKFVLPLAICAQIYIYYLWDTSVTALI